MDLLYTSRTITGNKNDLIKFHIGGTWVYTDSWHTFQKISLEHAEIVVNIMREDPISRFGYLASKVRKDSTFASYEMAYVRYLSNLACANDMAEKLLCEEISGNVYASYIADSRVPEAEKVLESAYRKIADGNVLRFKTISQEFFDGIKGSYYWAKCLLEHLVHLGLAKHTDKWSVER